MTILPYFIELIYISCFFTTFVAELKVSIMFSKACEYGIRATLYIAEHSVDGDRVTIREIAKDIDLPEAFTAKILQKLARNNIVDSVRGPNGGFFIEKSKLQELRLKHIVYAIDGDAIYHGCGLGLPKCNDDKPCPVHHKFSYVRDELKKMLEETTIQELTEGLHNGLTFLKY